MQNHFLLWWNAKKPDKPTYEMSIFHIHALMEKQLLENTNKKTFLTKDESEKASPKIFIFTVL